MFSLASEVEYEAGPVNLKGRSAVQSATLCMASSQFCGNYAAWNGCLRKTFLILVTFNWHLQAKEVPGVLSRRP